MNGPAVGLSCKGSTCDNKLRLKSLVRKGGNEMSVGACNWSAWFNEDEAKRVECPKYKLVTKVQCGGELCRYMRFQCKNSNLVMHRVAPTKVLFSCFFEPEYVDELEIDVLILGPLYIMFSCRPR